MIKEAYCSFEISKLLKEKEFDEKTTTYFEDEVLCRGEWFEWNRSPLGHVAVPTLQMACAWIREKYGFHISILWNCGDRTGKETFIWGINNINNFEDKGYNGIGSNVYEETVEKALKYALENLI